MATATSYSLLNLANAMNAVKPTTLPRSLLKFPPSSMPATLPPPNDHPTFGHPFTISTEVYNALLDPSVPITIALVYATIVSYFNTVNAKRKNKPWAFSQTSTFKVLVILHNAVLALYSAWTCVGMVNALVHSFAGWSGEHGLAGAADSLCKIHGPRGLGSAATFNETTYAWKMTNRAFHLAADGLAPESTDVGRIWNEGLAFYGWLFYLSKFYEVVDTAIILAKGKKSSFLQTYHHAGAMLCVWAGIRYMSPPIWMFVLVNSFIHAVMYTFYLCTAMSVRIPKKVKQTLTTLQITQFVVGASYAFGHLFVAYKVPVSVPYLYHLGSAVSAVASDVPSHARSVTSSVVATASAGSGAWLKKIALRAAGREGLAENVLNDRGEQFGIDAVHIVEDFIAREETRYKDELQWTHCLDTSGQVFAILLNCMYLAPLTWLFVRFFITAYLRRVERRRSSTAGEKAQAARQSFQDASKGFARKVDEMHAGGDQVGEAPEPISKEPLKDGARPVKDTAVDKLQEGIEMAKKLKEDVGGATGPIEFLRNKSAEQWQETSQSPSDSAQGFGTSSTASLQADSSHTSNPGSSKTLGGLGEDLRGTIRERASDAAENAKVNAGSVGETVSQIQHDIKARGSEAVDTVRENIGEQDEHQHNEGHAGDNLQHSGDTSGSPPKDFLGNESPVNDEGESPEADLQAAPNDNGTGVEEATGAPPTEMKAMPEENGEPDRRAESETQKDQTEEKDDAELLNESDRIESHNTSEDKNGVEEDLAHESSKQVEQSKPDESSENPHSKADENVDLKPSEKPQQGSQNEASSEIQGASNYSPEGMPMEPTSEDDRDKVESGSRAVLDGDEVEQQEDDTQQQAKGTSLDEKLAKDAPSEQSSAEKAAGDEYLEEKAPPKTIEDEVAASSEGSEADRTTVPKAVSTEDATEKDAGLDQSTEEVLEETTGADRGTSAQELPSTGEEGQEDRASRGTEAEHPTESDGTSREDVESKGAEQSEAEAMAGEQAETSEGVDKSEDEEKKAEEMSFIDFEKKVEKETELSKTEPEEAPASASETSPTELSQRKVEEEHFEDKDESADTRKKGDDDVKGEEEPKINGDTKSHDDNRTSHAPLIHVDDDGAQPEQEQAGSKAPSVKSKTPSISSKTSQSLESKHNDDGDKENQAPEQEASKHDAKDTRAEVSDDTAKVRDDTPFAEAVKE